jgi:hypothetical protein
LRCRLQPERNIAVLGSPRLPVSLRLWQSGWLRRPLDIYRSQPSKPRNGAVAHFKRSTDAFPRLLPRFRFRDLMRRQLRLPPKSHTLRHRPCAPFAGSGQDQAPFELCQSSQHRQHQPPMWGGRIRPRVLRRPESAPRSETVASTFRRSRVLRASQSSLVHQHAQRS